MTGRDHHGRLRSTGTVPAAPLLVVSSRAYDVYAALDAYHRESTDTIGEQSTMTDNSKPGATPENPLPPNTPDTPYYIRAPILIDVVNVNPLVLMEWFPTVQPAHDVHGNALLTIPALVGESIPDGEDAGGASADFGLIGSGTKDDPYTTNGALYVMAPVTIVFIGFTLNALRLEAQEQGILAAS